MRIPRKASDDEKYTIVHSLSTDDYCWKNYYQNLFCVIIVRFWTISLYADVRVNAPFVPLCAKRRRCTKG
jgi:hypothetical protein